MLDSATEVIAHFIGEFEVLTEQARLRDSYYSFRQSAGEARELPHHDSHGTTLAAPLNLSDFTPNLAVIPAFPEGAMGSYAPPAQWQMPIPPMHLHALRSGLPHRLEQPVQVSPDLVLPTPEPPGSTVLYLNQQIALSDNDYLSFGGSGLSFHPEYQGDEQLAALANSAEHLSPLAGLDQPTSAASIGTYVEDARTAVKDFADAHAGDPDVTSTSGTTLQGLYVNGQISTDAAPNLDDHLPAAIATDSATAVNAQGGTLAADNPGSTAPSGDDATTVGQGADSQPGQSVSSTISSNGSSSHGLQSSVHLDTGANYTVNEAHIASISLGASVVAVAGDRVEFNAITQVNAIADHDQISSQLNGWIHDAGPSQSFNIAQFQHTDPLADSGGSHSANPSLFPAFWTTTVIQGDLVYLNWVNQFTFVNDHDVVVAASSGSTSNVIMGGNVSGNAAGIYDLGHFYDLIVVGGNVYNANLISQVNVLVDNDLVGAVSGFQTSGQATISTSGNLLWNSATIETLTSGSAVQAMPGSYQTTAANMASGDMTVDQGVLHDSAFAGSGLISVLYVSGSIYNLNYIAQHNIVGDSDQVALAMNAVAADPTANWSIVTGSNALVNTASITSLDAIGKTYVGGEHYSDAMLVQTGLVPTAADMQIGPANPDQIVNEAVAFLTDSTTSLSSDDHSSTTVSTNSTDSHTQTDMMHGVLS